MEWNKQLLAKAADVFGGAAVPMPQGLKPLHAKLVGISRGSVHYLLRASSDADLEIMRAMDKLHLDYPFMCARCLRRELSKLGLIAGRKRIGTLMRKMGIEALAPKPGTSKRRPGHKIYPYLLSGVKIKRVNQVWALDTTYIPMRKGFVYLTAVVDVASRKVLAHKTVMTLESCHAVDVISEAFNKYGTPEIVNTDQGSQFTAQDFVDAVHGQGCKLSMDGKGAWRDNVFVERLWRTVKYERVYLRAYDSVSEAKRDIANYIDWYNTKRSHSSLDERTPSQAYWQKLQPLKVAA